MWSVLLYVFLAVGLLVAFQQTVLRFVRRFWHFSSPPFFGPVLNSRLRLGLQRPDVVIRRTGISRGMKVLDVGCGSGAYTTNAARAVGEEGRVYALDIQQAMLDQLDKKLAKPENGNIDNLEIVRGSAFDMPFDDGSFDLAYMVTAFHEIDDRKNAMLEVKRVLKPGGILAVTQWLPYLDYPLRTAVVRQAERAGFELEKFPRQLLPLHPALQDKRRPRARPEGACRRRRTLLIRALFLPVLRFV